MDALSCKVGIFTTLGHDIGNKFSQVQSHFTNKFCVGLQNDPDTQAKILLKSIKEGQTRNFGTKGESSTPMFQDTRPSSRATQKMSYHFIGTTPWCLPNPSFARKGLPM